MSSVIKILSALYFCWFSAVWDLALAGCALFVLFFIILWYWKTKLPGEKQKNLCVFYFVALYI